MLFSLYSLGSNKTKPQQGRF